MATRLYIESTSPTPPVSPAYSAGWERTGSAARVETTKTRRGSAISRIGSGGETSTSASNGLTRQMISRPLAAQTISGTFKGIIMSAESNAAADMRAQVRAYVIKPDGTERGVLVELDNTTGLVSEYGTTWQSRKYPVNYPVGGVTVNPVDALSGDRIVIEFGSRALNASATAYSDGQEVGSSSATERPEDETNTTANTTPWFEFSQDIVFNQMAEVGAVSAQMLITTSGPARLGAESAQMLITAKGPARIGAESAQMLITSKGPARIGIVSAQLLVTQKDVNWGRIRFGASLLKLPPLTFHEKVNAVSGLVVHLDADQSVKWQNSDGTAAVTDSGHPVGAWVDLVSGRSAVQATAAARPTWQASAYQNKPTLRFDGGDDQLILPGHESEQVPNITLFIVAMTLSAGGRLLIAKGQNASGWTNPYARWILYVGGGQFDTRWNGSGATRSGTWTANDLKILELLDNDTYANGVQMQNLADSDLTYPNGLTPILISGNGVGSERWQGDVAEILIYNRSLTPEERTTIRNLLAGKYGINL